MRAHLGDFPPPIYCVPDTYYAFVRLSRHVGTHIAHKHFLCTFACIKHTQTMFTVMQNHKSSHLLPQGQLSCRHTGGSRVFTEVQAFVSVNKGNLLPPLLPSRLNPIMCHHSSPTCLFPSHRQRWLPISLNCLLCKVTAEEHQ